MMHAMAVTLAIIAMALSFSNGANDNFKGFATVWGSDTLNYRTALLLATACTLAGSIASLMLAQSLVQQFSGKGLLPDVIVNTPHFIVSVASSAAFTIAIATWAGLPVSTTHALIGGLVGAGLAADAGQLRLGILLNNFVAPLLLSPIAAALIGYLVSGLLPRIRASNCVCVDAGEPEFHPATAALTLAARPRIVIADDMQCVRLPRSFRRLSLAGFVDRLHIGSAGLICFARGLNDTPKLAALLVSAHLVNADSAYVLIALAMAAGGLLFARRVAETMSKRVTVLHHADGAAANLVTAGLVLSASAFGLPVSTTHVSVGSIAGVGVNAGSLSWHTLRQILLSWIATLPMAAFIAWGIFQLIST